MLGCMIILLLHIGCVRTLPYIIYCMSLILYLCICSVPNKGLAFVRLPDIPAAQRAVDELTGSVLAEEYTLEMATADTEMQ